MKLLASMLFIFSGSLFTAVYCHSHYPLCLMDAAKNIVAQHKSNPCPGFISTSFFYDAVCHVKTKVKEGGLNFRHQVISSIIDTRQLLFVEDIAVKPEDISHEYTAKMDVFMLTDKGRSLQQFYLGFDIENLWIAGNHVNWETGMADKPDATAGNHTHCSAFVAAACQKMGIYILCPPQHGQLLLANAQYAWLQTPEAVKKGWKEIIGTDRASIYRQVQQLANAGNTIVAICKNPDPSKPGHAAFVGKSVNADPTPPFIFTFKSPWRKGVNPCGFSTPAAKP